MLDTSQKETEKFEEYVIKMQSMGRKVGFDKEKIRLIIMHGATPEIKEKILMMGAHDSSIEEMERVAQLVEASSAKNRSSLEQAIKRVEMKVDAMNVAVVGENMDMSEIQVERLSAAGQGQRFGTGGQGQRRDLQGQQGWQNKGNEFQPRQMSWGQATGPDRGWMRNETQFVQRGRFEPRGGGTFRGRGPESGPRMEGQFNGQRSQFSGQRSRFDGQNGYSGGPRNRLPWDCPTCGSLELHNYTEDNTCPARRLSCYGCGAQGHLRRCCRSQAPTNQPSGGPRGPPQ